MAYFLGIDGGGTKTAAAILAGDGTLVGMGEGGASTYGVVTPQASRNSIGEAVRNARRQAGLDEAPFQAAFLGLGNVVSDIDRQAVQEIAVSLGLAAHEYIGVDHDIRAALAGGLSGREGMVLILGTGSACYGRRTGGAAWRSGGWGYLIDDGGSGYWLGIQAMHAAVEDADQRGPSSLLTRLVQQALSLHSMDNLMNRLYAQNMNRTQISALSHLVFTAASQGDAVAQDIMRRGCTALAECVAAVARSLGFDRGPSEVALVGGLTRAGTIYLDPLKNAIQERLPECRPRLAELSPALGAGILAMQMHTPLLPAHILANLQASAHRFETSN